MNLLLIPLVVIVFLAGISLGAIITFIIVDSLWMEKAIQNKNTNHINYRDLISAISDGLSILEKTKKENI
jgi:hypothetical protein